MNIRMMLTAAVMGWAMAATGADLPKAPTTAPAAPSADNNYGFRAQVKVEATDEVLTVHSDGIPDHTTGPFPNPRNPNTIRQQNYTFHIPRHPVYSKTVTKTPMGPIGVAINGVPFYNPYNAEGADAAKREVFDECCGHPDQAGRYHYHIYPKCVHTSFKDEAGQHSSLIGYMFDGFAVYGPNGDNGTPPTDLDECNGHADPVRGYHYHVTNKFPYIVGGYHGVVDNANFDNRQMAGRMRAAANAGPGMRGGPGGPGGGEVAGYHLLPRFAMDGLSLTDDQRAKLTTLEKDVRERLRTILTPEQNKQLDELRPPRPTGGGGQRPQGQAAPPPPPEK